MLDELLVYRDYVLIIVLKHNEVMWQDVKKEGESFLKDAKRKGESIKRCEIIEQAQYVHPADGQSKKAEVRQKRFSIE